MAETIELEKTYLLKYLPPGLEKSAYKDMVDIYIPKSAVHPNLRIRKRGSKMEITKKSPVSEGDASKQVEQTIPINESEFGEFNLLEGKRIYKRRYTYNYMGKEAEVDIFKENLEGLILVDFEFSDIAGMESFKVPDFCLAEVTQEDFIAGGMLAGKKYLDIENELAKFSYRKLDTKMLL